MEVKEPEGRWGAVSGWKEIIDMIAETYCDTESAHIVWLQEETHFEAGWGGNFAMLMHALETIFRNVTKDMSEKERADIARKLCGAEERTEGHEEAGDLL